MPNKRIIYPSCLTSPMTSKPELMEFWKRLQIHDSLLEAFSVIPRENFVPPRLQIYAYEDQPLPTIRRQSISQPTTIMVMLQALELQPGDTVFEVGAGVGYQAALISQIIGPTGKLVSLEVIPELVHLARRNLADLGLTQAQIFEADGSEGYPAEAPYDKAVITAACPTIPQPIIDQLKEGGIVVAPVGDLQSQTMVKGRKVGKRLELTFLGSFVFVPMKGKYGFKEVEMFY